MVRCKKGWFIAIAIVTILISSITVYFVSNEKEESVGEMEIYFFNIGHGLSVLIKTPDEKNILIDAGSFDNSTSTEDFLKELEIGTIDAMFITHPHPDHISFAIEVLENHQVFSVYQPGMIDNLDPIGYSRFMDVVEAEGCPSYEQGDFNQGDHLKISEVVDIEVIWVDKDASNINNGCIALKLIYKEFSIIFAADTEFEAEKGMIESDIDLSADILQVGHHGVNTSSSSEFLSEVMPKAAIISAGFGYGIPLVPQTGVIERLNGVPIYLTMFKHWILVTSDGEGFEIATVR